MTFVDWPPPILLTSLVPLSKHQNSDSRTHPALPSSPSPFPIPPSWRQRASLLFPPLSHSPPASAPSATVASLLHIQLLLCSHLPTHLSSSAPLCFLLPDTCSHSLAPATTHCWYCAGDDQEKLGSCWDAAAGSSDSGWTEGLSCLPCSGLFVADRKWLSCPEDYPPIQWNNVNVMRWGCHVCLWLFLFHFFWKGRYVHKLRSLRKCENCFCSSQALFCCLLLFPRVFWLVRKSS